MNRDAGQASLVRDTVPSTLYGRGHLRHWGPIMRIRWLALLFATLPAITMAQAPTPVRINATIVDAAPGRMTVRDDGGATTTIILPPGTRYGTQVERSLSDIKPGEFVGSAAMRHRDGTLHAQEVHIFPPEMRGTGEGHRPMELPDQTMTNAAVDGVAEAPTGRILTMRYPGGEQRIEVGPDVRVVAFVAGDASLLKPGITVTVRATRAPDGTITAIAVQAEKDGVKPLP